MAAISGTAPVNPPSPARGVAPKDSDGDNDNSSVAAASAQSQPPVPRPTQTLGNNVNTYA